MAHTNIRGCFAITQWTLSQERNRRLGSGIVGASSSYNLVWHIDGPNRASQCLAIGGLRRTDQCDLEWLSRCKIQGGQQTAKRARQLKASWLEVGRQRLLNGAPGMWAYNLFSISSKDLTRLEDLHRAYFREMQRIVSESTPGEHVALFCAQLFPLDEFSSREAPTSFAPNTASFG